MSSDNYIKLIAIFRKSKLSDNELNIKIKQQKQDFMLLLIEYYKKIIETKYFVVDI